MSRHLARAGAVLAILVVIIVLLIPLPESWHGRWQSKFFDLGHVPLFAALTLGLWFTLGRRWPWPALLALGVAGLAELVQDHFGRTGNWEDFVRGALGVAAAVVLIYPWRPPRTWSRLAAQTLLVLGGVLAWPVLECGPFLLDAVEASWSFPTLADFGSDRQMLRWQSQQAVLTRQADPGQASGHSAQLVLLPGPEEYPGVTMDTIVRDWTGWRRLCCTFRVVGESLVVVCSLRGRSVQGDIVHYQFEKNYLPGEHQAFSWNWPRGFAPSRFRPEPLDLRAIHYFQVFIYRPKTARTLWLHRIWLE